jgi:hypothetical protein
MNAIVVYSWYTDEPVFALFIGSEYAVSFTHMEDNRLVGKDIYIPINAFADLAGLTISIE